MLKGLHFDQIFGFSSLGMFLNVVSCCSKRFLSLINLTLFINLASWNLFRVRQELRLSSIAPFPSTLSPVRDIGVQCWAPGFGLVHSQLLQTFGDQTSGWEISVSLPNKKSFHL